MKRSDRSPRRRAVFTVASGGSALLACLASGCVTRPAPPSAEDANRRLVGQFVHAFYEERDVRGAFEHFVAPDYVQHNPNIPDGREAAIVALTPLFSRNDVELQVRKVVVDGDFAIVLIFAREPSSPRGSAVADIFRLSNGRIVEHWDILQAVPEHPVNPHPLFQDAVTGP